MHAWKVFCDVFKKLGDVQACLCRSFNEQDVGASLSGQLPRQIGPLLSAYLPLLLQIQLIAHQYYLNVISPVIPGVAYPFLDTFER